MFNMGQIVIESQEPLNPRDIDIEYRWYRYNTHYNTL